LAAAIPIFPFTSFKPYACTETLISGVDRLGVGTEFLRDVQNTFQYSDSVSVSKEATG
jgi:hypothetical protein